MDGEREKKAGQNGISMQCHLLVPGTPGREQDGGTTCVPAGEGRGDTTAKQRVPIDFSTMSSGYKVVNEVHVGGREQVPSEWVTNRVVFHNFAEVPAERGVGTSSPVFECHGLEWQIMLYPGGFCTYSEGDLFISVYLCSKSCTKTNKIRAKSKFRVPSAGWAEGGEGFKIFGEATSTSWGHLDYAKREDVLDSSKKYLVDGNLTVEVDIQIMLDKPPVWTPTNTVCSDMLAFLNAADADNAIPAVVTFEVASGEGNELLYAHGPIFAARCPTLASLVEGCDPDTPILIGDVQADVFRMLLRFIYGSEVPSKEAIKEHANDIIHAADKYGCTGLKLAAEADMAAAGITTENAAELILFADATNCALLKETAMEYFVKNADEVMASEGYKQVTESPAILQEMVAAVVSGSKKRPADSTDDNGRNYKRMRVAELRQKLASKGMDVDGSKDMLVARLEEADEAADEEERKKNSIAISRAGIDDANGLYSKTSELSDGRPVYQKMGVWQERTGRFCVFRCRVSTNIRKWLVSFVPDGHRPGTTEDVDFYSADHDDDDDDDDDDDANLPPEDGWNLEDEGLRPSPTVKKSVEEE